MKVVGDALKDWALSYTDESYINWFGKSAVNRYYYATLWEIVNSLYPLDNNIINLNHSSLPEKLKNRFKRNLKKHVDKQHKANIITEKEKKKFYHKINRSTKNLSLLMENAYHLRVRADYRLNCQIKKDHNVLYIDEVKFSEIERWQNKAEKEIQIIYKLSKDLGVFNLGK